MCCCFVFSSRLFDAISAYISLAPCSHVFKETSSGKHPLHLKCRSLTPFCIQRVPSLAPLPRSAFQIHLIQQNGFLMKPLHSGCRGWSVLTTMQMRFQLLFAPYQADGTEVKDIQMWCRGMRELIIHQTMECELYYEIPHYLKHNGTTLKIHIDWDFYFL